MTVKNATAPYKMTFSIVESGDYAGLYTIVDANGKYLSATGGDDYNNLTGLEEPAATSYWSVAENTDGTYDIVATQAGSRNNMRLNYNNGNSRVSCYASSSTMAKPVLYPFSKITLDETPVNTLSFKRVNTVTSGKVYLIVASEKYAMTQITSNYGYPAKTDVTVSDDIVEIDEDSAPALEYIITNETGGYTIKQVNDNRYLYQTGTYNNFNVNVSPSSGQYFSFDLQSDGTFKVTNLAVNKYLQYSTSHSSYGSYADEQGLMPALYKLVEEEFIITITQPTEGGTISCSAETATEGEVITLTATPGEGYVLSAWDVKDASNNSIAVSNNNTFTMPASDVTVSAIFIEKPAGATTATIKFGTNDVKINAASVTGQDDQNNTWTITTEGTTSFTANAGYYQVGSSSKPATSITFTTTLPETVTKVDALSIKLGGFSGTSGEVTLKVGSSTIGTGNLNASNDVTVSSSSSADGRTITITVTNITKGVKVYNIIAEYE